VHRSYLIGLDQIAQKHVALDSAPRCDR
jgi:hypothetical protein